VNERIQKVLARAGVGSRRQIEAWIKEGRIAVNGTPAPIGAHIGPRDRVTLDGRPLRVREPDSDTRVILYHRSPRRSLEEGEVDEPIDLGARLPKRAGRRWIPISPLPPNDGGLEILTSDGELAQALMRKLGTLRIEFALRIRGEPTLGQLEYLKSGVIEDRTLEIESVVPGGGEGYNRWLKLVTRGARARDVHRLCAAAGLELSRVLRVAIGPLQMDRSLVREHIEPLPPAATDALYELAGVVRKGRVAEPRVRKAPGQRRQDRARARPAHAKSREHAKGREHGKGQHRAKSEAVKGRSRQEGGRSYNAKSGTAAARQARSPRRKARG